jgi:uncharacterized PurR-regulated membrane protein YhhQ (DUF165 family)
VVARPALRLIAAALFVTVVVATNALTAWLGEVTWLGIAATAGTWLAGFGFVARDRLQDVSDRRWVIAVIGIGAALSALFSPRLALASGVAFALSELADFAVYTPLREQHRIGAALASNTVGSLVDTVIFLAISGFPFALLPGQMVIKVGTTTVFVLAVRGCGALLRNPVQPENTGRDL